MKESEKKTEVGVNMSSGAEKVEAISKESKRVKKGENKATQKKTVKKETVIKREQAESAAAKARVEKALKKKEEKEKRAAEKKAKIEKLAAERKALAEKRAAEKKAKIEKRAAERKALAEKRKAEKEARIRNRAHAKANRKQTKSRTQAHRKQEREARKQNRTHRSSQKGYGGWIAAVVTLGVLTLALGTTVTVGAIDMMNTKNGVMAGHRATTYELVGIMEHVDDDLDRARVSASSAQQQRILTDLLVQARIAELDLEKMPITADKDANFTAFINRMGNECERMLSKLRMGESLNKKDEKVLQDLYETNHKIRMALDEYAMQMCDKDIMQYVKNGEGKIAEVMDGLENVTMPENRNVKPQNDNSNGAGTRSNGQSEEKSGGFEAKIEPSKAEELALVYFADYPVKEYRCVGESMRKGKLAYNVQGFDDDGTMLFAEVDAMSGELITFNYYKECNEDNFDLKNARRIAEEFLEKLGYENLEAVRVSENGTDGDFTFVYEEDGVVYYPDTVKVKVCRTRGMVTGMDATEFLRNHRKRQKPVANISLDKAEAKLHDSLEVENARAAVVKTARGEKLAYEFYCSYEEEKYLVYIDAQTGEEISIMNIKNLG